MICDFLFTFELTFSSLLLSRFGYLLQIFVNQGNLQRIYNSDDKNNKNEDISPNANNENNSLQKFKQ